MKLQPSPNTSPRSAEISADAGISISPVSASDPASAGGVKLNLKHRWLAELIELVSSTRFLALSFFLMGLAALLSVALPQHAPQLSQAERFGEFWALYFTGFGFFDVHNAPWFLLLMAILAVSSSLCIFHNTPKMVREFRAWNDHVSHTVFKDFRYRSEADIKPAKTRQSMAQIRAYLVSRGYQLRERRRLEPDMPALVAKKGGASRIGYLLTHIAVVILAAGNLVDSSLPVKISGWWFGEAADESAASVPLGGLDNARLPATTPSYRANTKLAEGGKTDQALVVQGKDTFVLDLPFNLELKKFRVEYYPTGMPKLFSSDVALTDKASGDVKIVSVEADKPLIHQGIAIHQSSFGEGSSRLTLALHPLIGVGQTPSVLSLGVGESTPIKSVEQALTLEILAMSPVNVQSPAVLRNSGPVAPHDLFKRGVVVTSGPDHGAGKSKPPTDLGPSITYRLKQEGSTQEFHVYMMPVVLDGARVFIAGVKTTGDSEFNYLRIPADHRDSLDEFMRIRSALAQEDLRELAARRFAIEATTAALAPALADSAEKTLASFAESGIDGLARALEQTVPPADRARAAEVMLNMLAGSFWELWQAARERDDLPEMLRTEANTRFAQQALSAVSDARLFGAPVLVTLRDIQEVRASVFQVIRLPGRLTALIAGVLLLAGLFAMLLVQERRVWVWVNKGQYGDNIKIALSTSRDTFQFKREFLSIARVMEELRFHRPDELVQRKFQPATHVKKP